MGKVQIFGQGKYIYFSWRNSTQSNTAVVLADHGHLDFRPIVDLSVASSDYFRRHKRDHGFDYLDLIGCKGNILTLKYSAGMYNHQKDRIWYCSFDVANRRFFGYKSVR
jgi:hypothetical protein